MADEHLEPTPGSPNGGVDGGEEPHDGGDADPAEQDIESLPDWAKKRLNNAETAIVDLKKTAGVTSVKELKGKLAPPKPATPPAKAADPAPKNEKADYVTREEVALLNEGYSTDELAIARRLNPDVSLREAVEETTAKAAINGIRQSRRSSDIVPEPSSRTPVVGNKSFSELAPADKSKNYGSTVDKLIAKGRQSGNRSPGR